jgi:hypothetical protein
MVWHADPLFCDLLANLHLHLENEVDVERVLGVKRTSTALVMSNADAHVSYVESGMTNQAAAFAASRL